METTTNLDSSTIDALQDLIKINIDSSKGFAKAAEQVENKSIASLMTTMSRDRSRFADELRAFVQLNDKEAEDAGSIRGSVHRWWLGVVGTVRNGDEHAVLAEAERGEDAIKHTYEKVLPKVAGNPISPVLHDQYARVKAGHDKIRDLRDAKA